ncbi:MAG TPA: bifunctional homocysteine S-methyltransferase/methylenetetrahydrofolate reductase [Dehalococcoidia bacterium]|nr:bifunctional homocysteine S-methyltransferase/methylenetetrahydrofolate reductase [Dehalococcoidia bacterium]
MNRSLPARTDGLLELPERLRTRVLVCDGAIGTMLHAAGVSLDLSLPELSVSRPELVRAVHGAYLAAGAELIETNSFGASRPRLARHGLESRVHEINFAAAAVARAAVAAADHPALVAGSVGPATPAGFHGHLPSETLQAAFHEQIAALHAGGVDLLLLETFGGLDELLEAIAAAGAAAPSIPVIAEMTFLEDGRTPAGETPAEVGSRLDGLALAAIGANCTLGPQGLLAVLRELGAHSSLPLAAQPNAGAPTFAGGRFRYTADPPYFARHARRFVELGAAIVGGCCGTTPAHVEAVAAAVSGLRPAARAAARRPRPRSDGQRTDSPAPAHSRMLERCAAGRFVLLGELPPPTGGSADEAVRAAALLKRAGCDAVLIGPPSSARAQASPTSLAALVQQRVEGLEAILGVAAWERSLMSLQADLLGASAFSIVHVLCRSGTPPLQGDYPNTGGIWDVDSLGLIQLVRALNGGRDHHGIPLARPTAFVVGAQVNPAAEDLDREIEETRRKIEAGVDFLITPPVYDLAALDRLLDAAGVRGDLPVLLGTMILRDFGHAEYLRHEVPGVAIPDRIVRRLRLAREDGPLVGRQIARELIAEARAGGRVRGAVLRAADGTTGEIVQLAQELAGGPANKLRTIERCKATS